MKPATQRVCHAHISLLCVTQRVYEACDIRLSVIQTDEQREGDKMFLCLLNMLFIKLERQSTCFA